MRVHGSAQAGTFSWKGSGDRFHNHTLMTRELFHKPIPNCSFWTLVEDSENNAFYTSSSPVFVERPSITSAEETSTHHASHFLDRIAVCATPNRPKNDMSGR